MARIQEILIDAIQHYQSGHFYEATHRYHKILQEYQNKIDALYLLSVIAVQNNNIDLAIKYFSEAVKKNPLIPAVHYGLGNALREQGQLEDAIAHYQQSLNLDPNNAEVYNSLGLALEEQGRLEVAITSYKQAIALQTNFVEPYNNLGLALKKTGQLEVAIASYKQAIALQPNCAKLHNNLANALQEQNLLEEAIAHYGEAIALQPNCAEFYSNLASVLKKQNRYGEAITHYQQALTLKPNSAEIHYNLADALLEQGQLSAATRHYQQVLALGLNNPEAHYILGRVLMEQNQLEAAISHYQQALALNPQHLEVHNSLGVALVEQGQLQAAITHYEQAIKLNPTHPNAHYNLSMALLMNGNFRRGFAEYEWRWQTEAIQARLFPKPLWDGSSFKEKTILLHGEQGFGDQIQFIRYVSLVAQAKGRIVVECASLLVRLFSTIPGISQVVARGETLPDFDIHAPFMSLPLILGTTLETVPAQIPYLYPITSIPLKLENRPNIRLKVGIVWSGNPLFQRNYNRSCSLSYFLKLLDIPNIAFYSLQKGFHAAEVLSRLSPQGTIQDLGSHLTDFADTAFILRQLDLIISVDTAIVHLAGALGKPTWVLLSYAPDWRWMLEGEDSPWYPTMRLFRQSHPDNWQVVFEQVEQALHNYMNSRLSVHRSRNQE